MPAAAATASPAWGRSCGFATGSLAEKFSAAASPAQAENEDAAFSDLGTRPHLAFVRLHDLIHDGQTQPGAAFELRLEGLKDFLHQLPAHAGTGVGKVDLPVLADLLHRNPEHSPGTHGTDSVLAKIPEHLLDLVAIGNGESLLDVIVPLDANPGVLRSPGGAPAE